MPLSHGWRFAHGPDIYGVTVEQRTDDDSENEEIGRQLNMATLNEIRWRGLQTFEQEACSAYEAATYLFMFRYHNEQEVFDSLKDSGVPQSRDDLNKLRIVVHRVKRLVSIWSIFRQIENISGLCKRAKGKLINGDGLYPGGGRTYFSEDERAYSQGLQAVREQGKKSDIEIVQDGVVALAAIRWYVVQVRHLIGKVGASNKDEVDWFWTEFGEHHHINAIDFRNSLAHFHDVTPSILREDVDWFVEWLNSLTAKIQRTCIAVPDKEGMTKVIFPTSEIARLSKIKGKDVSSSNSLVHLGIDPDLIKRTEHPVKFNFISFDPGTRRLTPHSNDFRFAKVMLSGRKDA